MRRFSIQISVNLINGSVQEMHVVVFKTIHFEFQILIEWIEIVKYMLYVIYFT